MSRKVPSPPSLAEDLRANSAQSSRSASSPPAHAPRVNSVETKLSDLKPLHPKVFVQADTNNETLWDVTPRSKFAASDEISTRPGGIHPRNATVTPFGAGFAVTAPGTNRDYHAFQGGHDPLSGTPRVQWDVHEKDSQGIHRQTSFATRNIIAGQLPAHIPSGSQHSPGFVIPPDKK